MEFTIRLMENHEKAEVAKLGRRSFVGFESLIVPTPKTAMVAVIENKIVGAVLFKIFMTGNKKVGYIDFAFVNPSNHGLGIGKQLYKRTMELLWNEGCDYLSAVVKDDNVDSWKLLLNNDFERVGLYQMVKELGLVNAVKHSFKTSLFVAIGMEYYLAKRDVKVEVSPAKTSVNILGYFMLNTLLYPINDE